MTLKVRPTKEELAGRQSQASAAWKARNPDGMRDVHYKNRYGIGLKEYNIILERQGGVCAICKNAETAKDQTGRVKGLAIDHCHATGVVRGLLCSRCNHMLGHSRDNTRILQAAISYLELANTGFKAKIERTLDPDAATKFLDELAGLE